MMCDGKCSSQYVGESVQDMLEGDNIPATEETNAIIGRKLSENNVCGKGYCLLSTSKLDSIAYKIYTEIKNEIGIGRGG